MTSSTTGTAELLSASTVADIVGDVFTGLFGAERGRPHAGVAPDLLPVGGSVTVTGAWSGDVEVTCSRALAESAACDLLELSPTELVEADVRDAVGELANIVGGNVKSVLPGPNALSLPSTYLGDPRDPHYRPGARTDASPLTLALTWSGEPVRVSIWTMPTDPLPKGIQL